jgi:hypothetical protein
MELEGFGASLIGRVVYVVADDGTAWLPWEFIAGTTYSCRILVTGEGATVRLLEASNTWTAVMRPTCSRDWSFIATMVKGGGPTVLLVVDAHAPSLPAAFVSFLDGIVAEGRTTLTQVFVGTHMEIPAVPDALFFPPLPSAAAGAATATAAYEMASRLPGRAGHGPWRPVPAAEWHTLVGATAASDLGVVVSDIGESEWSLFWHKPADSAAEGHGLQVKRGATWMRTGVALLEKHMAL